MYNFNGRTNVYLKALSDTKLLDKEFKAGDVVVAFTDVDATLTNNTRDKVIEQGTKNILSVSFQELDVLSIQGIANKEEYNYIFFSGKEQKEVEYIQHYEAVGNSIFLNEDPNSILKIESQDNENISFDKTTGEVTSLQGELPSDLFVTVKNKGEILDRKDINIGYLSCQIVVQGERNDEISTMIVDLPKVSILSRPIFEVGNSYRTPLELKIIEGVSSVKYV